MIEYNLKDPVDWGIEFHDGNYIRNKWDETEVLPCPKTIITRNGEKFYTVLGDRDYSIPKAMTLLNEIDDHPLAFETIDYDKHMIGRKIWYSVASAAFWSLLMVSIVGCVLQNSRPMKACITTRMS